MKLTHKNLVCNINWYLKYYAITPEDCSGEYAGFGFDMHMYGSYAAFAAGASLCIVPEESRLDLQAVNECLEQNNITHLFMTTQVGRQFAVDSTNHSLKTWTAAGEKLAALEPPKNYAFINAYGPTETTMIVTAYKVRSGEKNIPIGKAIDNTKL